MAFILLVCAKLLGQQQPAQRGYLFTGVFWNPAMTAPGSTLEASLLYSQHWVGIQGAPTTAFASAQIPFPDLNMAAGLILSHDQAGPLSNLGLQGNYAYKLKELLDFNDELSIGLSVRFSQWRFNPANVVTYSYADPTLYDEPVSRWQSRYNFGLFYTSDREFSFQRSHFYVGLAADNLARTSLPSRRSIRADDTRSHTFALGGYRHMLYTRCWEPSIWADWAGDRLLHGGLALRFEEQATYWGNTAISTDGSVRLGGGWMYATQKYFSSFLNTKLSGLYLIGMEAEFGFNRLARHQGMSYHLYMAYRTKMFHR